MKIRLLDGVALATLLFSISTATSASPLLAPELQSLSIYSSNYALIGARSQVFGNVSAGNLATTGAGADVFGNLTSVGAATTGGGGSLVTGNILSGGAFTTLDGSLIGGNITASGAATIGANTQVTGNMVSVGAATTGATSRVGGYIHTGAAASTGANSVVVGEVAAVGAISIGANSVVGSQQVLVTAPLAAIGLTAALTSNAVGDAALVRAAQTSLNSLGSGTLLAATMTTDTTLHAGVYSAASLSTTAGTTLTLDGQGLPDQIWVFNITDILSTGASTKIVVVNAGAGGGVIWNTGGYASLGASSVFTGTILADTYISVGAGAQALGFKTTCGGLFSASSYVSTGDGAKVGGSGCTGIDSVFDVGTDGVPHPITALQLPPESQVPEPRTWIMLITGFFLTGSVVRRRSASSIVAA